MNTAKNMDGIVFAKMLKGGAANLNGHVQEINNLNVFPIPDGDTGDNMLLTLLGGTDALKESVSDLSQASKLAAYGIVQAAGGEGVKNAFTERGCDFRH